MADREKFPALTRGALLRLASVCDRLGDQADPSQIAAMAANRPRQPQDAQTVLRAVMEHFLEWLEPRWRGTPVSRGEMIRSMVRMQDEGLLDGMFNPTPEGWQQVDEIRGGQRPRPRPAPDTPHD